MESPEDQKELSESEDEEIPLLEIAFDNICFYELVQNIMNAAPNKIEISEIDYKIFKDKYDLILKEYEKKMEYEETDKLITIQKYIKIKGINSLTEEDCLNYLKNNLYLYIKQIFSSKQQIIKYITPIFLYTYKNI